MQLNTDKFHDITAHVLFLALFFLAFIFDWERLYVDAGYYLMQVINHKSFWIEHKRLILIFPEWLPLLGVYLRLSVKSLVMLYSIGHVLFFYGAYLISRYKFGNTMAGYQLAFAQVLGLVGGFFVPVFEMYYGCGLAVIFFSIMRVDEKRITPVIISLLILAFALISHPMMLFIILAILAIKLLKERKITWYYLWMALVMAGVFIIKSLNKTIYEAYKTERFINGLKTLSYDIQYLKLVSDFALTYYIDVLFLLIMVLSTFLIAKKWWEALIFLGSLIVIAIFCNVMARDLHPSRYTEQVYFPIAALIILVLPFLPLKQINKTWGKIVILGLLIVFGYRISLIIHAGRDFHLRTQAVEKICLAAQNTEGSKFIISEAEFDSTCTASVNWSLTIESLLHTSAETGLKTVAICTDTDYNGAVEGGRSPNEDEYVFRLWETYADSSLNTDYFKLANGTYKPMDIETIINKH